MQPVDPVTLDEVPGAIELLLTGYTKAARQTLINLESVRVDYDLVIGDDDSQTLF